VAADNHTTIVGNLVEDPEVRSTNTGIAVANLRVAVTQRAQQDGQWRDGKTNFFKVNVWRGRRQRPGPRSSRAAVGVCPGKVPAG
jgi:single-strand DNA-binding protein